MTRKKKIVSGITTFVLGVMMTGSVVMAGTAVQPRNIGAYDFYFETNAGSGYPNDTWDVTTCRYKETTSRIDAQFTGGTGTFDVSAIGSHSEGFTYTDFADCSNGNVYRMTVGDECYITNYVIEWGYQYAGLKGVAAGDDHYYVTGRLQPDIY